MLVSDVCLIAAISEAAFYVWNKNANLGVSELRRLKLLEDENARLKRPLVGTVVPTKGD